MTATKRYRVTAEVTISMSVIVRATSRKAAVKAAEQPPFTRKLLAEVRGG